MIMPKLKSHSGAKKRFIVTKNGKVKHKKIGLRHLLTGMSANRGRKLRRTAVLDKIDTPLLKKVLPYEW
jgi:large subunit ribosomal protein L35